MKLRDKPFVWVVLTILVLNFFLVKGLWQAQTLRTTAIQNNHIFTTQDNSSESSTFTIHADHGIYNNFSEDWYLYFIRSKRIISNGFTADVMNPDFAGKKDFRELVQVAVCALPAMLGEKSQNMALIYMLYLTVAALLVYWAVIRIIPHPGTGLILTVVIFLSMLLMGGKLYRISTIEFAFPLVLLMLSAIYRLLDTDNATPKKDVTLIGIILFLLGGLEVWSFALCFGTSALFLAYFVFKKKIGIGTCLLALAPAVIVFVVPSVMASAPGITERAGMTAQGSYSTYKWIYNVQFFAIVLIGIALLGYLRAFKLLTIFLVWVISIIASVFAFGKLLHMNSYELFHFGLYNASVICMLAGCAVALKILDAQSKTVHNIADSSKLIKPDNTFKIALLSCVIIAICFIAAGKVYPKFDFIKTNWEQLGYDKDIENVDHYFQSHQPGSHKTMLVLNYEYNYNIAYHTNLNMLLPSGFSLHSTLSTGEILNRMQLISDFLGIKTDSWSKFLLTIPKQGEKMSMTDRFLSAREWFTYFLLHRTVNANQVLLQSLQKPGSGPKLMPDYVICEPAFKFLQAKLPANYEEVFSSGEAIVYQRKLESK